MKKLLVVIFIVHSVSAATDQSFPKNLLDTLSNLGKAPEGFLNLGENEQIFSQPWFQQTPDRGWILSKEGKKAFQNIINTMPCGWPEYGIPPLAPYTREEFVINYKTKSFDTSTKLIRFRVDGLDTMLINKMKISYLFGKKITYSFTVPKIVLTGKIDAGILLNLMPQYGINIRYDDEGIFEMILEDLTIAGSFKYKVPYIFGSVKIYDFTSVVSLGNVVSNTEFTGTAKKLNKSLNKKIEDYLLRIINNNQNTISDKIEEAVVPLVNEKMKGKKIWYFIGKIGGSSKICYPPPIPWSLNDNKVL